MKGKSYCLYVIPQVPFCPCLLANLSPIWGILTLRTLTLANLSPEKFYETMTISTQPFSALLDLNDASLNLGLTSNADFYLLSDGIMTFPTRTY